MEGSSEKRHLHTVGSQSQCSINVSYFQVPSVLSSEEWPHVRQLSSNVHRAVKNTPPGNAQAEKLEQESEATFKHHWKPPPPADPSQVSNLFPSLFLLHGLFCFPWWEQMLGPVKICVAFLFLSLPGLGCEWWAWSEVVLGLFDASLWVSWSTSRRS